MVASRHGYRPTLDMLKQLLVKAKLEHIVANSLSDYKFTSSNVKLDPKLVQGYLIFAFDFYS